MSDPLLTIGMAVYDDFHGVFFTVQSLRMHHDLSDCEIVVVDNGSTDDTAELIRQIGRSSDKSVRYVYESRLGLHHARHAGVRAARGNLLVFTDDDATFDRKWLQAYANAFHSYPEMVAAGGPVRPIWEKPPAEWLLKYMDGSKSFPVFSLMEPHQEFRIGRDNVFFGVVTCLLDKTKRLLIQDYF